MYVPACKPVTSVLGSVELTNVIAGPLVLVQSPVPKLGELAFKNVFVPKLVQISWSIPASGVEPKGETSISISSKVLGQP